MAWRSSKLLMATTQSDSRPNDVPKRRSEGQGRVKKVQDNEIRVFGNRPAIRRAMYARGELELRT